MNNDIIKTDDEAFYKEYMTFKQNLPTKTQHRFTPDVYRMLVLAEKDPMLLEEMKENFLSFATVLNDKTIRTKIEDYVNAIKYVSHRLLGKSVLNSYKAAFPNRVKRLMEGATERSIPLEDIKKRDGVIRLYADKYNQTKLVMRIMSETIAPTHVLNAPVYQKAINKLVYLMENGSERAQLESASKLLDKLQPPENTQIKLDIGIKNDETIVEKIRSATEELVAAQRRSMELGVKSINEIAESEVKVIEAEIEE